MEENEIWVQCFHCNKEFIVLKTDVRTPYYCWRCK